MTSLLAQADLLTVSGLVADTIDFSSVDGPGNRFTLFLQGCNFDCIACHNPQTIPGNAAIDGHQPQRMTVNDVLERLRPAAPFVRGVTISGGEATQQPRFVHALLKSIFTDIDLQHLTTFVDSNGACPVETWDLFEPYLDGAMIDLKCFDPLIHKTMTGHSVDQVLESIEHLADIDRLHEVRLLIVPGYNDDPELLRRTGEWLASIDSTMRIWLIGFRLHGTRTHNPPLLASSRDDVVRAAAVLAEVGDFGITMV